MCLWAAVGQTARMIRVTYVGHATVEIETSGVRLLTDPVLLERVACPT